MAEIFANDGQAIVTSGGTTAPSPGTIETWTLAGSTLPVLSGPGYFYAADDAPAGEPEKFLFTANNGTTATVTRGADGSSTVAHAAGFSVSQVITRATLEGLANSTAWINVVSGYDADRTGAADSTSAWASAITAARTYGADVYGPYGTYKTTATIDYTGVTIIGDGSWPSPDQDSGTVFVPTSAVTGSVLQNSCPNTASTSAVGGQLYGIGIDGSSLTGTVAGIYAAGNVLHGVIEGVSIYGVSGNAIDISSANSNASGTPYGWHVRRVKIDSPGGYGVSCGGHTDGIWDDVHVLNPGKHGWYVSGAPSNSRFAACRGEWARSGYCGLYLTGTWNNSTGSGGCVFTAFSTDRNDQDGIRIDAVGNEPVIFEGLMLRRDGRNGGSGGGSYAGLALNSATIPVIIGTISVFPGVDDTGSGTNSPEYGVSVTSSSYLEIAAGYIQGATNAVHQTSETGTVNIGPNVFTATGTTSSPTVNTVPYFATLNGASLFLQKTASSVATLSVTNLQSAPSNATTQFYGASAGDKMIAGAVTGDADARLTIDTNGKIQWGSGGAVQDTDLYRSGAGTLATDDNLTVGEALTVSGLLTAGGIAGVPAAGALPSGALAETIPRWFVQTSAWAITSTNLYISEITLQGGIQTAHGHWLCGSTGCASPSHWWYVLLDHTLKVVAVTADQTSAAITASTDTALAWASAYTPAATGIFYLGVMVNASSMPTAAASSAAPAGSVFSGLPFGGVSNTGETTPPSAGTTMTTPTAATQIPYMYVS